MGFTTDRTILQKKGCVVADWRLLNLTRSWINSIRLRRLKAMLQSVLQKSHKNAKRAECMGPKECLKSLSVPKVNAFLMEPLPSIST